ncbi:unnamed protein product [Darwinula stevensoni]|uniref:Uncharacterized protein n=1 Tax=Darwinula stevensoni TaxID=69355 RepID=A0A7R8XHJ3_9CRUS|nr:unnamed protein product [Darwinula stevensoni]CAG0890494.1 unnamed protein product [Darwinula stevensoni]
MANKVARNIEELGHHIYDAVAQMQSSIDEGQELPSLADTTSSSGNGVKLKLRYDSARDYSKKLFNCLHSAADKLSKYQYVHLDILNEFRTGLQQRYSPIESSDSLVQCNVMDISAVFQDLLLRAKRLSEEFVSMRDKQQKYAECVCGMEAWLEDVGPKVTKLVNKSTVVEPKAIKYQLDEVNMMSIDIQSQRHRLDSTKQAGNRFWNR